MRKAKSKECHEQERKWCSPDPESEMNSKCQFWNCSMCDFEENCNLGKAKAKECREQERKWCSPDPEMNSEFQLCKCSM